MKHLQIIAFKGCKTSIDFHENVYELIREEGMDVKLELISVPSTKEAMERGLFGSPTILIDGKEYQQERSGPIGFYCRTYLTSEGFRRYPLFHEIIAALEGNPPCFDYWKAPKDLFIHYPTLITTRWCIFHDRAIKFWEDVADELNVNLRIVDVAAREGERTLLATNAGGVPCLLAAPERLFYGINISFSEAKSFLQSSLECYYESKKGKVLVIDDDDTIREMLRDILSDNGYSVSLAANGDEGIDMLARQTYDIAITDIFMPGKDGFEVFAHIKRLAPCTKIIVLSGGAHAGREKGDEYLTLFKKLGAEHILAKPIEIAKLLDLLDTLVAD